MSEERFTVVLVQGAWHADVHAQLLIESLASRGHDCRNVLIPSNIIDITHHDYTHDDYVKEVPSGTWSCSLHGDSKAIKIQLDDLIENQSKSVVLVAHSYGGIPASQAAQISYSVASRRAAGKSGGIIGILFLASFQLPIGISMEEAFPPDMDVVSQSHRSGLNTTKDGVGVLLFSDAATSTEAQRLSNALVPRTTVGRSCKVDCAGYSNHPCGYMLCEDDKVVPIAAQQGIVQNIKDQGIDVKTWRLKAGHEAHVTRPDNVSSIIVDFAEYCIKK